MHRSKIIKNLKQFKTNQMDCNVRWQQGMDFFWGEVVAGYVDCGLIFWPEKNIKCCNDGCFYLTRC